MEDGRWVNCLLFGTAVSLLTAGRETSCWKIASVFFFGLFCQLKGQTEITLLPPSAAGITLQSQLLIWYGGAIVVRARCVSFLNEHRS